MWWIFLTLGAITFQTMRNLEQRKLVKKIDPLTASWARFILPFPLSIIVIFFTLNNFSYNLSKFILVNSIFQMLGSIFLVKAMQYRNYSIAITLGKTETIQALFVGLLFYNIKITPIEIIFIFIAFIGVILMSEIKFNKNKLNPVTNPANFFGIFSATCFAITSFNLKNACDILIELGYNNIIAATLVLLYTIFWQNIFFIAIKFKQKTLKNSIKSLISSDNINSFLIASSLSFIGSIFWYSAYSYGEVIHVKMVGQLEIIIALIISCFFLKERHSIKNFIGIFLVLFSILVIIIKQ